jgi:hypothetical protein
MDQLFAVQMGKAAVCEEFGRLVINTGFSFFMTGRYGGLVVQWHIELSPISRYCYHLFVTEDRPFEISTPRAREHGFRPLCPCIRKPLGGHYRCHAVDIRGAFGAN